MAANDPRDYVDRRYENAEITELPDAPIDALRGLGSAGSEALHKAIAVKTIRDLADNRFVMAAQEIVRLVEGSASPAIRHEVVPSGRAAEADASVGKQELAVEDAGGGR